MQYLKKDVAVFEKIFKHDSIKPEKHSMHLLYSLVFFLSYPKRPKRRGHAVA
jgi:hypothetical protein